MLLKTVCALLRTLSMMVCLFTTLKFLFPTSSIEDFFVFIGCVVPGAGAFEIVAHRALKKYEETVKGRARLGVRAFADALLIIPKVLATNSGHDSQETMVKLLEEASQIEKRNGTSRQLVGLDLATGEVIEPVAAGILDNYIVKKQMVGSA